MISIIIPSYNDEGVIKTTITHLRENAYLGLIKEIIVVDAGSTDHTTNEAAESGAIVVRSVSNERATLMNLGAEYATGKILYFLLPGTLPPWHFTNEIVRATQKGFSFGSFTMKFDYKHWVLKTLSWFTRQKIDFTRLEGQSLFIVRELFEKTGRFREGLMMLEDHELISRLRRYSGFVILRDKIVASAGKYLKYGVVRTELSYIAACGMYWLGYPQQKLVKVYRSLLGIKAPVEKTVQTLSTSLT